MSAHSLLWRGILWIERFLPTPKSMPANAATGQTMKARRRAGIVPVLLYVVIVLPIMARQRHELGTLIGQNAVLIGQLLLVLAGCLAIATIGFGLKAWRGAEAAH